jgi:hypothetical protein
MTRVRKGWDRVAALAAVVLLGLIASPAFAQWENIRVLDEGPGGVTFVATYGDLRTQRQAFGGIAIDVPAMDGTTPRLAPGQPIVLAQGIALAVPPDAEISLRILDARGFLVKTPAWPSAPIPIVDPDDTLAEPTYRAATPVAAPATGNLLPGEVITLDGVGYQRDRRIARVTLHPLLADLTARRALAYRSITVRVDFTGGKAATRARPDPWFEGKSDFLVLNRATAASLGTAIDPTVRPAVKSGNNAAKGPAVKVYVKTRGLYRLTPTTFSGLGISPATIDPRTLRVRVNGSEVAVYVSGEGDGTFDSGDALVFHGEPVTDSIYTSQNVYWVTWGEGVGSRAATRSATPSGSAPLASYFPWSEATESNAMWWSATPDWTNHDTWFWSRLTAPQTVSYTVSAPSPAAGSLTATLHTVWQGNSDTTTNPDHHTVTRINGTTVQDQTWDGQLDFTITATFSQSLLSSGGSNTLQIQLPNDTGSTVDKQYFNRAVIDYYRQYASSGGGLRFCAPTSATYEMRVTGLPDATPLAFDVTNPNAIVRLTGGTVSGSGPYTLAIESAASPLTWFEVAGGTGYKTPVAITLDASSSLASPTNGADYVLLTHAELAASAQALADRRAAQGLRTKVVLIEDVYDEFAYGRAEPDAIRAFLQYAYANWQAPAPLYVLLLGDATIDYLGYLGTQPRNLVPSGLTTTFTLGATPCDNRFFLAGADELPDFFAGRVPAEDAAYVAQFTDKVVAYEDAALADWHLRASFVADNNETVFETMSESLITDTPAAFTKERIYISTLGGPGATTAVKNAINAGRLLVNYFGHGSVESWAGELILQSSTIPTLTNGYLSPLVSSFNCLNGFFPVTENSRYCLSEAFLKYAGKGSCATFGPTGYGYASEHYVLAQRLWNKLFPDAWLELGAATTLARSEAYSTYGASYEIVDTYVLFGDPAMAIRRDLSQIDVDGDGSPRTLDCDDRDATVYPGAYEECDGKDNDCDPQVDEGCLPLAVPLTTGYNLLGRGLDHSGVVLASEIVDDMFAQGGTPLELAIWDASAADWRVYDPALPVDDFAVDVTTGFLVRAVSDSTWDVLGQTVMDGAKAIPGTNGYTLVAVPTDSYSDASALVTAMNGAGCDVTEISRWVAASQTWETHDPAFPLVDFALDRATGYLLRADGTCAFGVGE